jgi:hypothetical protein
MKAKSDLYRDLRNTDSKANQATPSQKKYSEDTTDDDKSYKTSEKDFRIKYKTEICKFWELNNKCKFGDKVGIL